MAVCTGLVKLFGKTFPVPAEGDIPAFSGEERGGGGDGNKKKLSNHKIAAEPQEKDQESPKSEEKSDPDTSSSASENHKPSPTDQETAPAKTSKPEEEQKDTSNSQEKTLKKPNKILPCPRCSSMDTKFCYYNNYNFNQPRHFCKNCQRYWTAGGTMRNVPVGAGRRKNKHSANHYRHITVSEATLQTVHSDIPEQVCHPAMKPNDTVLNFGSDMPLCESMASVLNLTEKTMRNCHSNGFHQSEEHIAPFSCGGGSIVDNGEEHSNRSSVTASNSTEDRGGTTLQEPAIQNCQGYPLQGPCFNGSMWPYPWNPAPALCASSFPISFYPATAYWGYPVPGAWSIPWPSPLSPSPPDSGSQGSGPNSPTLGKHSRDENVLKEGNSAKGDALNNEQTNEERCLWIPKTLRIDDPEEATMSSIWATMGIKNDKADMISRGGLFKAFQPKAGIKNHTSETSQVLHANPAAMSRSLNFQESS